jgi:hypothetical protein
VPPVSRDVPADDPNPRNARADLDPSGVFAALDKVVAEIPLATKLRTEGAPAASALERFDARQSAGVFAALDKVVTKTPVAARPRAEVTPATSTRERVDSEGPQPVRPSQVPSALVGPSSTGTVDESRPPLEGSAEPAKPADVAKRPLLAGANASPQFDLAELPVRLRHSGPGDLELRATGPGDPELPVAPTAAAAPRRQKASGAVFLTESVSQAEQDNRSRLQLDRAPFEHGNGTPASTQSAVWPLGFALVLGVSLGFAGGYEVASWQRQPDVTRTEAAAPAAAAPATSESAVRESAEEVVREPAALPTPGTPGTDTSVTSNAAQSPAVEQAAAAPAAATRLLINSTPAGARVVLDGRDVGETPVTVRDVANGAHTVRVVRDGYVASQQRVVVSAARPEQSLTIALRRPAAATPSTPSRAGQPMAALYVASRPAGASVFLDGKLIGTTPLQIGEVAPGDHTVRLELDGYQRWSSSVRAVAGERSRVAASLDR